MNSLMDQKDEAAAVTVFALTILLKDQIVSRHVDGRDLSFSITEYCHRDFHCFRLFKNFMLHNGVPYLGQICD